MNEGVTALYFWNNNRGDEPAESCVEWGSTIQTNAEDWISNSI